MQKVVYLLGNFSGFDFYLLPSVFLIWSPEFTWSVFKAIGKYLFILWNMTQAVILQGKDLISSVPDQMSLVFFLLICLFTACSQTWFFRRIFLGYKKVTGEYPHPTEYFVDKFPCLYEQSNNVEMTPWYISCQIVSQVKIFTWRWQYVLI